MGGSEGGVCALILLRLRPAVRQRGSRLQNLLRLRRANMASNFASPAARQQRIKTTLRLRRGNMQQRTKPQLCFACGAPTRLQILLRLRRAKMASKVASPARRANKASNNNFTLPAARQQRIKICFSPAVRQRGFKFCFACGAPTRAQILLRLRRTNEASNFASPAARQQRNVSCVVR